MSAAQAWRLGSALAPKRGRGWAAGRGDHSRPGPLVWNRRREGRVTVLSPATAVSERAGRQGSLEERGLRLGLAGNAGSTVAAGGDQRSRHRGSHRRGSEQLV